MDRKDKTTGAPPKPAKADAQDARQQRLTEALRANLRRRKDQARARREGDVRGSGDKSGD